MIYKSLGKSGLNVSCVGFGTYRVSSKVEQHHEALELALKKNVNLIDTSSNYADGESEILVGNVINKLISTGEKNREDFVVVSKGGYIQGRNLQLVNKKKNDGLPYEEVVICSPDLQHSIHPNFLSDQIDLSLERLQLDYMDVYLLHNPEYFLSYTKMNTLSELRDDYYDRIEKAFILLEEKVAEGKIKWYGISSNSFGSPSDKLNFTSLDEVIKIAKSISEKNHFAVVQFPLNAVEKKHASNKNQKNNSTPFLKLAKEENLGVLVNRPLNGIQDNQLIRLADFDVKENITEEETISLAKTISNVETEIAKLSDVLEDESVKSEIRDCLTSGKIIIENIVKLDGISQFREIRGQYLIPRANYAIQNLSVFYRGNKEIISALNNYVVHLNILLDSCESVFAKRANQENYFLHEEFNIFLSEENYSLPLSQKSILLINSLDEVSSTLVGMRKTSYVEDILKVTDIQPQEKAYEFWGLN